MFDIKSKLEELENSGHFINIGIIGIGQMGRGLLSHIINIAGMRVSAVAAVDIKSTINFAVQEGYDPKDIIVVLKERSKSENLENRDNVVYLREPSLDKQKIEIKKIDIENKLLVTDDPFLITELEEIDVIVDATGKPEVGARIAHNSILNRKHIVTLNVEGDVTIGPILNKMAKSAGVVYTVSAGDEPAATKELFDFASMLNLKIVAAGKGKNNPLDRYSTPEKVKDFAISKGSNPYMMNSFIDGTKSMIEMACLSNATGLIPDKRGMHGPKANISDLLKVLIPKKDGGILTNTGIVDYVIGDLAPGVFLIYTSDSAQIKKDLEYLKNGSGPYFLLYRPYHLASIETPVSIANAFFYDEPSICPIGTLISEVITFAKKDLKPGDILDGIGGFLSYGLIDLHEKVMQGNFLPIGMSEGAIIKRSIQKDEPIKMSDVELNQNKALFNLRKIQDCEIG